MSKRIEKDGKFYRVRRGKVVEIPPEWVGRCWHGDKYARRYSKEYLSKQEAARRMRAKREIRLQLQEEFREDVREALGEMQVVQVLETRALRRDV